jgi:hypothetical protein
MKIRIDVLGLRPLVACAVAASAGVVAPASAQVRVANYNISALEGNLASLQAVFAAMHADDKPGFAVPVGLFVFAEVRNADIGSLTTLVNNSAPVGVTYTRATYTTTPTEDGATGAQALFFRSDLFVEVPNTHANIATGGSRNTDRWTLNFKDYTSAGSRFHVYGSHLKASNTSADRDERESGVIAIRNNSNAFGAGVQALYVGDMNFYTNSEAGYQAFMAAGNGQAVDPLGTSNWTGSANAIKHTQSPRLASGALVGGGMDDRFDFILPTVALADGAGFAIIPNTTRAFGNDGNHFDQDINNGNNSYYPTNLARGNALADHLWAASDHIPVLMEMKAPAWCAASIGTYPARVVQGAGGVVVPVLVGNDAPGDFAAGIDALAYSVAGSGVLSGTSSGTAPLTPSVATVNVPVSTATVGVRTGAATVTSANQGVQNPSTALNVSVRVLRASNPSLSTASDVDTATVGFSPMLKGPAVTATATVANFGFTADQATLDVDSVQVPSGPFSYVSGAANGLGATPATLTFRFDPSGLAAATYSQVATIVTSDENIPGAASRSVTVTLSATIDPGAPGNPADLNGDGVVDGVDLGVLLSGWAGGGTSDLNGDGTTDGVDLGILLANWG